MKKTLFIFLLALFIFILFPLSHAQAANGWTETQPAGNNDRNWVASGMSDDGETIVIVGSGGRLYVSTNGGNNWTEEQPGGNVNLNWQTACVSGDGTTAIAGIDSGRLYLSTDGGNNFSETQPLGNVNSRWRTCAISDDGETIWVGICITVFQLYSSNSPSSYLTHASKD